MSATASNPWFVDEITRLRESLSEIKSATDRFKEISPDIVDATCSPVTGESVEKMKRLLKKTYAILVEIQSICTD